MHLFYAPELHPAAKEGALPEEEARHALKALRLRPGDALRLADGRGGLYHGRITQTEARTCAFEVVAFEEPPSPRPQAVWIALAPTKSPDRIEWLAEKATEIGLDRLSFFQSARSERPRLKLDRIRKRLVGAMKQSLQYRLPQVDEMIPLADLLAKVDAPQKFVAYTPEGPNSHLARQVRPDSPACVLVGPEGGFTEEEVRQAEQVGFRRVGLGPTRLRTETAALAACHALNLAQQKYFS